MGKCLSKICWQFSVSQSCSNERKAAVESPVKGVVNDDHESPAFMKNHAFSMTNAAYADFEKTARAPPPATEADNGHPSGCQHLIRSPSTSRSSEDRISDNPVQIFEKSASRKEGPAESALTKCSSRKQSLDGSISSSPNRIKSLALSHADFVLTKSPSRSSCNSAAHSPESECTACIFPSRSSITKELSENESKPCDDAMNMVQPLSTFGQEKESQTVSNADLLLEPCSICKKLNCNCCQLVTTLSSLIHESSELEVSDVSQLSDNPENAIDTPQVHQCNLKQSAIHEHYTDVKAKANGSAIRQSRPSATNHEVNPPEKLPAEMDLPATQAASSCLKEFESSYMEQNSAEYKKNYESMIKILSPSRNLSLGGSLHLPNSPTAMKRPGFGPSTRSTESFKSPGRRINATHPKRVHINEIKHRSILKEMPNNCASIIDHRRPQPPVKASPEQSDKRNEAYGAKIMKHDQVPIQNQIQDKEQIFQAESRSKRPAQIAGEDSQIKGADRQLQDSNIHAKAMDPYATVQQIVDGLPQSSTGSHKVFSGHFASSLKSVRKKYVACRFSCQNEEQDQLHTKYKGHKRQELVDSLSSQMINMLQRNPKEVRDVALKVDRMMQSRDYNWCSEVTDSFKCVSEPGINGTFALSNQKKRLSPSPSLKGKRGKFGTDDLSINIDGPSMNFDYPRETIKPDLVDRQHKFQVESKGNDLSMAVFPLKDPHKDSEEIYKNPACGALLQTDLHMESRAFVESVLAAMSSSKQTNVSDLDIMPEIQSNMCSKSCSTTPTRKMVQKFLSPQYDGAKIDSYFGSPCDKYGLERKPKSLRRLNREISLLPNSQLRAEEKLESFTTECKQSSEASTRLGKCNVYPTLRQDNDKNSNESTNLIEKNFQKGRNCTHLEEALSTDLPVEAEFSRQNEQSFLSLLGGTGSEGLDRAWSSNLTQCIEYASNASNLSPKVEEEGEKKPKDDVLKKCSFAKKGKSRVASPSLSWGSISFLPTSSELSPEEVAEIWGAFEAIQLS